MKITPINKFIQVKVKKPEREGKTKSGIITIDLNSGNAMVESGEVIAVNRNSKVKVGQKVFFKSYCLETIIVDEKDYHFLREDEILAVE
ncbi:co-chaperone GroES [Persephonella sp.]